MEKVVNIKTVIKNLNILTIVLRKFNFIFTHLEHNKVPVNLGDNTIVIGLIKDQKGMPVLYIIKKGNGYGLIPHHYDDSHHHDNNIHNDERSEENLAAIIHHIKREYIRTEILKTAFQCGWNRLSQRKNGKSCQIVLAV
jgi:hypothetical protein